MRKRDVPIIARLVLDILYAYGFFLLGGLERLFYSRRRLATGVMMLLLVGFDTWCLTGYILPYFYAQ